MMESGRGVRIHPSILSADFVNMQADLARISTADAVHVDVMDNHFVPNLTFGPDMIRRVREVSALPLDVHLMITDVDRWAIGYAELGAHSVTFHAEATDDPVDLARRLRHAGARAGIALKPDTPVSAYVDQLAEFDLVLVMTVEPGFGGQDFRDDMMPKLRTLREQIDAEGLDVLLQVDGGVGEQTIRIAATAGADTFVAGSSVYGADDPAAAITTLRSIAKAAREAAAFSA